MRYVKAFLHLLLELLEILTTKLLKISIHNMVENVVLSHTGKTIGVGGLLISCLYNIAHCSCMSLIGIG